jgi:hypothetical protein
MKSCPALASASSGASGRAPLTTAQSLMGMMTYWSALLCVRSWINRTGRERVAPKSSTEGIPCRR